HVTTVAKVESLQHLRPQLTTVAKKEKPPQYLRQRLTTVAKRGKSLQYLRQRLTTVAKREKSLRYLRHHLTTVELITPTTTSEANCVSPEDPHGSRPSTTGNKDPATGEDHQVLSLWKTLQNEEFVRLGSTRGLSCKKFIDGSVTVPAGSVVFAFTKDYTGFARLLRTAHCPAEALQQPLEITVDRWTISHGDIPTGPVSASTNDLIFIKARDAAWTRRAKAFLREDYKAYT
ncbi:hypothetical protein FOZ63_012834, partial [Perkinsus olseni]